MQLPENTRTSAAPTEMQAATTRKYADARSRGQSATCNYSKIDGRRGAASQSRPQLPEHIWMTAWAARYPVQPTGHAWMDSVA